MTRRNKKHGVINKGSAKGDTRRMVNHHAGGPTEAQRIALVLLEKRYYGPRTPKPVTLRKFSWEGE